MELGWILIVVVAIAILGLSFWAIWSQQKALANSLQAAPQALQDADMSPGSKQLTLLRQYHDQGLGQSKTSFSFSIFFAALGFVTIIASLIWSYQMESERLYAPITEVNKTIERLIARRTALESQINQLIDETSFPTGNSQDSNDNSSPTESPLDTFASLLAQSELIANQAANNWRAWAELSGLRSVYDANEPPADWVDDLRMNFTYDWPLHAQRDLQAQLLPNVRVDSFRLRYRYDNETRRAELEKVLEENRVEQWVDDFKTALQRPVPGEMDPAKLIELTSLRDGLQAEMQKFDVALDGPDKPSRDNLVRMIDLESRLYDLNDAVRSAVTGFRILDLQTKLEAEISQGLDIRTKLVDLDNQVKQLNREEQLRKTRLASLNEKLNTLSEEITSAEARRQKASETIASPGNASIFQSQGSVLGLIAGAIVEAVSALFFVQSNRSRELMVQFFDRLRSDRRFDESMQLVADIDDKEMQNMTRRELALGLSEVSPPE